MAALRKKSIKSNTTTTQTRLKVVVVLDFGDCCQAVAITPHRKVYTKSFWATFYKKSQEE